MEKKYKLIKPENIRDNVFQLIDSGWMLITAGNLDKFNMMTASWGGFGVLWNKYVCFCVIRPGRYTFRFVEKENTFTLCFFDEKYRDALNICGSKSGRDTDKTKEAGLTPAETDSCVYFREARMVIECRKIYFQDLNPENFLDKEIDTNYPNKDYHRMYVGEILKVYVEK